MLQNLFNLIRDTNDPIFSEDFDNADNVFTKFRVPQEDRESIQIILAVYQLYDYDGSASVYFFNRNDKKYYEVHGSHCSCHGLEDQWDPEEICFPELDKRFNGSFYGAKYQ